MFEWFWSGFWLRSLFSRSHFWIQEKENINHFWAQKLREYLEKRSVFFSFFRSEFLIDRLKLRKINWIHFRFEQKHWTHWQKKTNIQQQKIVHPVAVCFCVPRQRPQTTFQVRTVNCPRKEKNEQKIITQVIDFVITNQVIKKSLKLWSFYFWGETHRQFIFR